MKIRTNQLEDIIMQSSSQVLCHNWKLELMGLPKPVMCRSEHRCLEHALCFPAVPLVCHLHLKWLPLIKSHMSPQNNNFKTPPSSSVPLNQSQTWQTVRMELGCLQAIKAGWETESGKQGSRAVEWAAVSRTSKRHKDAVPHIHLTPLAQQSHTYLHASTQDPMLVFTHRETPAPFGALSTRWMDRSLGTPAYYFRYNSLI